VAATKPKRISGALAAATCTVLGTSLPEPVQAQEDPGWNFNTSALYYRESDNRVTDYSIKALATRLFALDHFVSLGVTIDTLTGATPNGATRQDVPQTFTRPSGRGSYTVPAGELPLDDTFHDTRVALTANWQKPIGDLNLVNLGVSFSKEYDYTHFGVNAKFARDFNKRNTTLSAGLAWSSDNIDPVGGAPFPNTPMRIPGYYAAYSDEEVASVDAGNRLGDQDKDILDAMLGVTQLLTPNLLVQLNYSYSAANGYLTDPYKILTLEDPIIFGTPGTPPHLYWNENRPDERTKHSVYFQTKYFMRGKILDASYRYMSDDWEINSHTLDLRYRWPVGTSYLEPHVRYYTQTAADFYSVTLPGAGVGPTVPPFASADFRLANFDAITTGLKYGWKTHNDNDMSVRVEWYTQSGSTVDLDALIVQFSYRF